MCYSYSFRKLAGHREAQAASRVPTGSATSSPALQSPPSLFGSLGGWGNERSQAGSQQRRWRWAESLRTFAEQPDSPGESKPRPRLGRSRTSSSGRFPASAQAVLRVGLSGACGRVRAPAPGSAQGPAEGPTAATVARARALGARSPPAPRHGVGAQPAALPGALLLPAVPSFPPALRSH